MLPNNVCRILAMQFQIICSWHTRERDWCIGTTLKRYGHYPEGLHTVSDYNMIIQYLLQGYIGTAPWLTEIRLGKVWLGNSYGLIQPCLTYPNLGKLWVGPLDRCSIHSHLKLTCRNKHQTLTCIIRNSYSYPESLC